MALPSFLIIGAPRAGTTSLYHYLRQHPDVYMSPVKEARYFWYEGLPEGHSLTRNRQAYERLFDGVTSQRAIGEASPQYLSSATAPERIAADIPAARLIVSLRNPADRAYSSYLGALREGRERRSVEAALQPGTRYCANSLYHDALTRYLDRFDRSRIKVIVFDDFAANPHGVLREIHDFLQIDGELVPDVRKRHSRAGVPRLHAANVLLLMAAQRIHDLLPPARRGTGLAARLQRLLLRPPDPLPTSKRRQLLMHFRDDVLATGALVGRDLSHWLA
jgi:hypothetical protein